MECHGILENIRSQWRSRFKQQWDHAGIFKKNVLEVSENVSLTDWVVYINPHMPQCQKIEFDTVKIFIYLSTPCTLASQGNCLSLPKDGTPQVAHQVDPFLGAVHQLTILRVARCSISSSWIGGCARGLCIGLTEDTWGLSGWYVCIKAVRKADGKVSMYHTVGVV